MTAAFNALKAWLKEIEDQQPVTVTDCPECGWTVSKLADGRVHCEFCGWPHEDG